MQSKKSGLEWAYILCKFQSKFWAAFLSLGGCTLTFYNPNMSLGRKLTD